MVNELELLELSRLEKEIKDLCLVVSQVPEEQRVDIFDKMIMYNNKYYDLAGKYCVIDIPLDRNKI